MTQTSSFAPRAVRAHSAEIDALITCVRVEVSDDELHARLGAVTDWHRLRDLALQHAMLPLLYERTVRAGQELVPPLVLRELTLINRANAERCIRLTAQLLNILSSFDAQGITAVGFKGPLLSQYAYGDVTMRTFQDLDLFVPESDLVPARRLLEAQGLLRKLAQGRAARGDEYHDVLRGSDVVVELHWRTGPAYVPALQADELLRRSRPRSLLGRAVLTLDPADLLLVLSAHGHAHNWSHLELVAALARVLAKDEFGDPVLFLRRARSLGCLRRCLIAFQLAKDVARAELPPEFETAIASDRLGRRLSSKVTLMSETSRSFARYRFASALWRSLALDKPKDALRFAALQVFAPRAEDVIQAASSRSLLRCAPVRRIRRLLGSMRRRRPSTR